MTPSAAAAPETAECAAAWADPSRDRATTLAVLYAIESAQPAISETKRAGLIEHYGAVAGLMLPYLKDRPVSMARYPDGITGHRIFQKNAPDYFPDWITLATVQKKDGVLHQVICDKPATLVYLANQACIEMHVFLGPTDRLDHPDQLVVDLAPPGAEGFGTARRTALWLRALVEDELEAACFVKTTGGRGLHVHVPLDRSADFDPPHRHAARLDVRAGSAGPDAAVVNTRRN